MTARPPRPGYASLGARRGLLPDLPGPVGAQRAGPEARAARAMGRAADGHGFKGGDLLGVVEHLDRLARPGRHRALLQPDLPVGLEPPIPHGRLLPGRSAARRGRRPARAPRRRPRARHAGRPRRRLQPRRPRLLAVPPRRGERAASPYRDWFYLDAEVLDGGRPAPRLSPTDARSTPWTARTSRGAAPGLAVAAPSSATRPGGTCRPCPS